VHNLPLRLTRQRRSATLRAMLQETYLHTQQLIAPVFVSEVHTRANAISSMPGVYQLPLSTLTQEIDSLAALNIPAVILFGLPAQKDAVGSAAVDPNGIIQRAIRLIRKHNPDMVIIADVCLCEYTDHGHCGILNQQRIDNAATLNHLAALAVSYAEAGADWVAPSSMTDGMVARIRQALDECNYHHVAILSYAVKYSSSFYGPFREAALGAPQFGDRKTYQMNPCNAQEGVREAELDVAEGADMLMVKPAMNYLDMILRLKQRFPSVPLCAYQVSGEYAMIKKAAACGLINEHDAMLETLTAIKRAGADLIITYFAKDLAKWLFKHGSSG